MVSATKAFFGALACVLALMWLSVEPAAATPLRAVGPVKAAVAASTGAQQMTPTKVHWRGRRHHRYWRHHRHYRPWRHHRRYRPGVSFWFGGPLYAPYVGVPYDSYRYRPGHYSRAVPPPRYYRGRPVPGSPEWYAYCASKYKSFNPRTGLYLAYSGKYRRCR